MDKIQNLLPENTTFNVVKIISLIIIIIFPLYLIYSYDYSDAKEGVMYGLLFIGFSLVSIGFKIQQDNKVNQFLKYISGITGTILMLWVGYKWRNKLLLGFILTFLSIKIFKLEKYGLIGFNKIVFWFSVIYIIHIIWVILTFTSPNLSQSIDLPNDKQCNAPWLYYGKYPPNEYNLSELYHEYMFDITTWFPPPLKDSPDFTCQPCPTNFTPIQSSGTNIACRPCNEGEEWYSIHELNQKYENNLLNDDEKREIGNNGRTLHLEETGISNTSLRTYHNDHSTNFPSMNQMNGMCLSERSTLSSMQPYRGGSDCNSYANCMEHAPSFIELSWPTQYTVFPNQIFEMKNLETPLTFRIPENIFHENDCTVNTNYNSTYHNPICNQSSIHNSDNSRCYLKIPIEPTPLYANPLPPENYRLIRHGGSSTGEGPPCDIVNSLSQNYNIMSGLSEPDSSDINDHTSSGLNRYINDISVTNPDNGTITSSDWRNIIGMIYDECNNHDGRCYIDNFICQTSINTAIPLVDYTAPSPVLTIPQDDLIGCKNATLTGSCNSFDEPCDAMEVTQDGLLIPTPGSCRYAKWENSKWNIQESNVNVPPEGYHMRCFPENKKTNSTIQNGILSNVKHNSIFYHDGSRDNRKYIKENICKRIKKFTDPELEAHIVNQTPCSRTPSNINTQGIPGTTNRRSCSVVPSGVPPCSITNNSNHYMSESNYHSRCCMDPPTINSQVESQFTKTWQDIQSADSSQIQYTQTKPVSYNSISID